MWSPETQMSFGKWVFWWDGTQQCDKKEMPPTRLSTIKNPPNIHKSITKPNIVNKWCQHDQKLRSEVSGRRQKWAKREPKGAKSSPKRDKRCPKSDQSEPKRTPKEPCVASRGPQTQKTWKNDVLEGPILGAKVVPKASKKEVQKHIRKTSRFSSGLTQF